MNACAQDHKSNLRCGASFLLLAILVFALVIAGLCVNPHPSLAGDEPRANGEAQAIPTVTGPAVVFLLRADVVTSTDEAGTITVDPVSAAHARDNLTLAAQTVLENPNVRLTACVPALLLEQWQNDTEEGGSQCVELLGQAQQTGQLELLTAGYADPSFPFLSATGRVADITGQYARNTRYVTLTFSEGTYPAQGQLTRDSIGPLRDGMVEWTVASSSSVTVLENETDASVELVMGNGVDQIAALISSDSLTTSLARGDAATFLADLKTAVTEDVQNTAVCTVNLNEDPALFVRHMDTIGKAAANSAYQLAIASSVIQRADPGKIPRAVPAVSIPQVSPEVLDAFTKAERSLSSLSSCLYSSSSVFDEASRLFYLSECGNAADGVRITSLGTAGALANDMLGNVHLDALNMTFAGASGEIPLTIINDTDAALELIVTVRGEGITSSAGYTEGVAVVVYSGENYLQIPVTCDREGADVIITVGGTTPIVQQTIWVKTSHINQITLVVCGVLVVAIVAATIYRRIKRRNTSRVVRREEKE